MNSITNGALALPPAWRRKSGSAAGTVPWRMGPGRSPGAGRVLRPVSLLPPGAMTARLDAGAARRNTNVNEFNRDAAIESAKIEVENALAVEQAIRSRMAAMQAATDASRPSCLAWTPPPGWPP